MSAGFNNDGVEWSGQAVEPSERAAGRRAAHVLLYRKRSLSLYRKVRDDGDDSTAMMN